MTTTSTLMNIDKQFSDGARFDLMMVEADRWLENEMWNQRHRRRVDLHDVAAFVHGFNAAYLLARAKLKSGE